MSTPSLIHSDQPAGAGSTLSRNERELLIVRRVRNGDREALKSLWDEYRRPLYHFFARSIHSREEVEDLTSETMLAVFNSIHTFRGVSSFPRVYGNQHGAAPVAAGPRECTFSSFVYSIAANHLKQWLRRRQVRRNRTPALGVEGHAPAAGAQETEPAEWRAADASADPLTTVLRREYLDSVCFALADVGMRSCEQFKALVFHYACGLPHKDVASLLSTRKETINARLQEGRVTLKEHYASSAIV